MTVPFDEMDLTPYLHSIAQKVEKPTYKMIAHIDHEGELNSGHYTA